MRWRVVLAFLATLMAVRDDAGAARKSTCTEELRACRAQCHGTSDRRDCRQRCADARTCATPGGFRGTGAYRVVQIDTLAGRLRQVTHFPADAGEQHGCGAPGPGHACDVTGLGVDPVTGSIVIASSCDPLGRNPNGEQFFTMRADGSGLRQISAFRGVERIDDGVQVEMAGPPASSLLIR